MLLNKLYQFQRNGFIGLGAHIGYQFKSVILKPDVREQIHGAYYVIIGGAVSGTKYDSYAVLLRHLLHKLRLTAVRAVYRQESGYILLIV